MKLADIQTLTKSLRNFNPAQYINSKEGRINSFFYNNKLDSCVIGISGGIDSAVTLGLLRYSMSFPSSPIKKILPLLMPIGGDGTTGQDDATRLGIAQCEAFKMEYKLVDLSTAYQAYLDASGTRGGVSADQAWANGQLASILRTPCSYYHAALLQTQGLRSLVVGTTNRDEGSYVGFYGKASDAMVDLQPIADIHKSEVRRIAKGLGVIPEIIDRAPRGDVWDGRTSEEMMGVPYWFLEMYLLMLQHKLGALVEQLEPDEKQQYWDYKNQIETWHFKNFHKYQVGLPSHFIDCMERKVPGGW